MKFSNCVLLAAIAVPSATAFVPMAPRCVVQQGATTSTSLYSLDDLEAKLLGTEEPAPKKKASKPPKPAPAPKPAPKSAPAPKPLKAETDDLKAKLLSTEEPAPAPKKQAVKSPKPAPAPKPARAPKPAPAPKAEKPKPAPKPKPTPKAVVAPPLGLPKKPAAIKPPPPPPPSSSAQGGSDSLAKGVALGAAPLVVAPLAALAAGRGFLTKTAARRAVIQEEIAEREAALAKKKADAEVDVGGLVGALVRVMSTTQKMCRNNKRVAEHGGFPSLTHSCFHVPLLYRHYSRMYLIPQIRYSCDDASCPLLL